MKIVNALLVLVLLSVTVHAETFYAKKKGVKVTGKKSPLSRVVATLQKGDAVELLKKGGRHYRVRLKNGREGWVFKFKLSKKKPAVQRGSGDILAGLTGESSVTVKEARSAGSIRGLKKVSKNYASLKRIDKVHVESVERMEKYKIDQNQLTKFKRSGRLGEFYQE